MRPADLRRRGFSVEEMRRLARRALDVGPTGLAGLFWPDGELCAARAARGWSDSDGRADQPAGCSLPDVEGALGAARPIAAGLGEGCSSVPATAPARRSRVP